jgi:hypothetical protein
MARDTLATETPGPVFFVHVMKTGGSTFRRHLVHQLGRDAVFPHRVLDADQELRNTSVSYLAQLPAERLAGIRAFTGHFPFFATELVPTPSLVLTLLRDPVDRTVSYLKQHHRDRGLGPERTLESIYESKWHRRLFILDYQVRVFATTATDGIESVMEHVEIDEQRMAVAKDHLRRVDVIGMQDDHQAFVADVSRRLGWPSIAPVRDQRVSAPVEISASFRRRIAEDNRRDVEFYEFARELHAERRRASA